MATSNRRTKGERRVVAGWGVWVVAVWLIPAGAWAQGVPVGGPAASASGVASVPVERVPTAAQVREMYYADEDCCTSHLECQDGSWCTGIEWCNCWGVCLSGARPNCDDGNDCTVDNCVDDVLGRPGVPGTGGAPGTPGEFGVGHCDHVSICGCRTDSECNDSSACTVDTCDAASGTCVHTPVTCNDVNVCTSDSCNASSGCVYTPIPGCCATDADCGDGNACTTDTCNTATGVCGHANVASGTACPDDGNACTNDRCNASGVCTHPAISCDDGNVCTTDTCNTASGCVRTPVAGCCTTNASCNDLNPCTTDTCNTTTGTCVHGAAPSGTACPADANACTFDRCNGAGLCTHPANPGGACDDGLYCTVSDLCNGSAFCVGTARNCADALSCTTDSCNEAADTCVNALQPGFCLIGGVCYANGASNPTNPCQFCNSSASTTVWSNRPAGTNCDDGQYCNGSSTCNATGTCLAGTPPCNDGLACTADNCNEVADACLYPVLPGWCLIAGVCYTNGTLNPVNSCEACNSPVTPNAWTPVAGPVNDTCGGTVTIGVGGSHTESTMCAQQHYTSAVCGGGSSTGRDIAYQYSFTTPTDYQLYHYRTSATGTGAMPNPDPFIYARTTCADGTAGAEWRCNDECSAGFVGTNYGTACGGLPGTAGVVVVNPVPVGMSQTTAVITDGDAAARGTVTTAVARENHNNNDCYGTSAYHAAPNVFPGAPPATPTQFDYAWRGNNVGYGNLAGVNPSCGGSSTGPCGGPFTGSGSGGGSGSVCLGSYNINVIAGNTYTISTCGSYGGDPYLRVTGACTCSSDDACGAGSQCTCTATSTGVATICASTYSSSWASWSYTVTGTCSVAGGTPTREAMYRVSVAPTPRVHFFYDELALIYDGNAATTAFDGIIQILGPDASGSNCTDAPNAGCSFYAGNGPASIVLDQSGVTRNYWVAMASTGGEGQYELRALLARAQFWGQHQYFGTLRPASSGGGNFDLQCTRLDFTPDNSADRGYTVTWSAMPGCGWGADPVSIPGQVVREQLTIPWNYDDCSVNYPIGFNFLWGEQFYNRVVLDTNGRIRLSNDSTFCSARCFDYSCGDYTSDVTEHYSTYMPEIAVLWTDLVMCGNWSGGCYAPFGYIARQLAPVAPPGGGTPITAAVLSWVDHGYYNGSGGDVDMQVILYIDGRFSLIYRYISGSSGWSASNYGIVGIAGTRAGSGPAVNFR